MRKINWKNFIKFVLLVSYPVICYLIKDLINSPDLYHFICFSIKASIIFSMIKSHKRVIEELIKELS
jgi:hypothetical protein